MKYSYVPFYFDYQDTMYTHELKYFDKVEEIYLKANPTKRKKKK